MKLIHFGFLASLIAITSMTACSGKKSSPEDEIREFGKYFIEKISANQLDSLKSVYPDILLADSIVPVQNDTVIVSEVSPGQYEVTLEDGVILKVKRSDDGNIKVKESRGLFAYPADRMNIAKKTGMWNDKLSDDKLAKRMKDDDFFYYIENQLKKKTSTILTTEYVEMEDGPGARNYGHRIKNNTDVDITADDYVMIWNHFDFLGDSPRGEWKETSPGKPIPARGSIIVESYTSSLHGSSFEKVKLKLTPEQIAERFVTYTGNEYQEYLSSKM